MDASATFGRVIYEVLSGTSGGSYSVPPGCFAIIEIACNRSTTSGFGTTLTVDGTTRNSSSDLPSANVWASDFAIIEPEQTVSWAFSPSSTGHYRILVLYKATPS